MIGDFESLLAIASSAAHAAAELLRDARPHDVRSKGSPHDLVTEWDVRSEELIRSVLDDQAPGIPVLGEEGGLGAARTIADTSMRGRLSTPIDWMTGGAVSGAIPTPVGRGTGFDTDRSTIVTGTIAAEAEPEPATQASGLRWLVDPIDGTVNFAHGLPLWSISIALERAGELLAGVVVAPALGWWFGATLGGGARDGNGRALHVSATPRLAHALLTTGFPYDRASSPENNFAEWEHFQRIAGACRRLGCASLDLCLVARGAFDGYWERKLKPWDIGAGALIVAEAGGTVTNTRGGRFDPHMSEVVASNGAIHEELIAELGGVRRPGRLSGESP